MDGDRKPPPVFLCESIKWRNYWGKAQSGATADFLDVKRLRSHTYAETHSQKQQKPITPVWLAGSPPCKDYTQKNNNRAELSNRLADGGTESSDGWLSQIEFIATAPRKQLQLLTAENVAGMAIQYKRRLLENWSPGEPTTALEDVLKLFHEKTHLLVRAWNFNPSVSLGGLAKRERLMFTGRGDCFGSMDERAALLSRVRAKMTEFTETKFEYKQCDVLLGPCDPWLLHAHTEMETTLQKKPDEPRKPPPRKRHREDGQVYTEVRDHFDWVPLHHQKWLAVGVQRVDTETLPGYPHYRSNIHFRNVPLRSQEIILYYAYILDLSGRLANNEVFADVPCSQLGLLHMLLECGMLMLRHPVV